MARLGRCICACCPGRRMNSGVGCSRSAVAGHPVVLHRTQSLPPRMVRQVRLPLTRTPLCDASAHGNRRGLPATHQHEGSWRWLRSREHRNRIRVVPRPEAAPVIRFAAHRHLDRNCGRPASKNAIAVFPVSGWWKNRARYDQSVMGVDYSLIISIDSPEVDVDVWTPIAMQIGVAIPIET